MFENEAKGWYGSYSRVGKGYAERFYIISHKDEIFSRENKKMRIKDFFNPDEIKQKSSLEETLDVYKVYTNNKKNKEKFLRGLLKHKKTFLDYSLHKKKLLKKRKLNAIHNNSISKYGSEINQPGCTRYYPNYNYIKPRLLEGPFWKDVPGRNQKGLNPNEDRIFTEQIEDNKNYKYYILEGEKSKCLVNMNKTTQRGEFGDIKDLRIRTDKAFIKPKKKNKTVENGLTRKKSKSNNTKNKTSRNKSFGIVNKYEMKKQFYKARELLEKEIENSTQNKDRKARKKISKIILKEIGLFEDTNNIIKDQESINNMDKNLEKQNLIKRNSSSSFQNQITKENISLTKKCNKTFEKKNKKIKCKAPDFDKIISREQVDKAKDPKFYIIPFITPNYTLVTDRPLTMTDYDKSKYRINNKDKKLKGLDYSYNYIADKIIDKYNNHIPPKVPNFNYMTSRPNKKGCPLPTYMQNVHDRLSVCNLNDKTLVLNNYSNRGYSPAVTTFFPKKSFNNIINYSVINSKRKMEKKIDEDLDKKLELLKLQANYEPQIYEQFLKEGTINKFDKITLKTNINKKNDEPITNVKKDFLIII